MRGPRGQVSPAPERQGFQRCGHRGVHLGGPARTPGREQRGDAGALGQAARLAAPAADGAGRSAGLRRRSGVRLAAFHSSRDQVLGVADGGEACAGALALLIAGPLPRGHIGQELACLGVVPGAGFGVVYRARASRFLFGRCIGTARFLHGRRVTENARGGMVWRNVGRRMVRRSLWAAPGCGHSDSRAFGVMPASGSQRSTEPAALVETALRVRSMALLAGRIKRVTTLQLITTLS